MPTTSGDPSKAATATAAPDRPALSDIVTASDYAARVQGVAERIVEAKDQATVHTLLTEGVHALGAENAVFVSFIRDNADLSACRFMLVCEPDWCRRYLDAGCFAQDPWLAYAAHHSEPIPASMLPVLDPEGQRVIALAMQNGFASAALVPAHSGAGHSRISLLCLGSTQTGFFDGEGFGRFRLGARLLAAELHDWWLARIRHELIVKARITQADLELLRHEHQGHSSKRIAAELHVSKSSINSRFQRMNMKLGVPNRRLAARLAVECGLLIG
ncbi:autoinducer binding domain-containing protein [Methylibium sp.]|uniref:helix-turn-helix transcriptional regulator n=1 Tax=Methylibium sp. TaxID=2067992 RepID=UPI003D0B2A7E